MIDGLLAALEVPSVGHRDALGWRTAGVSDFEDALQVACAVVGAAGVIVSRNIADFTGASVPVITPEDFLTAFPKLPTPEAQTVVRFTNPAAPRKLLASCLQSSGQGVHP